MNLLVLNLLIALLWLALTGRFSAANLALGYVIGFIVLWYCRPHMRTTRYFEKLRCAAGFVLFFLWELVKANLKVAFDVMTPRHRMRPGVIAVPLDARSDTEITLLANLITLTPGTLSLDLSTDRRVLYVHVMYIDDVDSMRREIKEGLERRVLELLR